jgi:hypothetical protein
MNEFSFRFLWDAHNCEESLSEDELGISANYLDAWNDLSDLWFLGMQVLNSLMPQVSCCVWKKCFNIKRSTFLLNGTVLNRHQCRKTTVLGCNRCTINTGIEKMNYI